MTTLVSKRKGRVGRKKILTREFLSHSVSHAVRVLYILIVIRCWSQSLKPEKKLQLCLRVYGQSKLRGHTSMFFHSFFGCKRAALPRRGILSCCRLSSPLLSPHVLRSAFWWWTFSPFFTPCSRWGFPLDIPRTRLWCEVVVLYNLKIIPCCVPHARSHTTQAVAYTGAGMKTDCACPKDWRLSAKMRVNDQAADRNPLCPVEMGMQHGQRLIIPLYYPLSPTSHSRG